MKFFNQVIHKFLRSSLRHPQFRWIVIAASLFYLVSPLDISPDVFPVIGWLDDGMVITLLATEVSQFLLERRKARKEQAEEQNSATVVS